MKTTLAAFLGSLALVLAAGCGSDRLPTPPLIQLEDRAPSWSPDGRWIAFIHFNPDLSDTLQPSGLYLVDSTGSNRKLLLAGHPRSVDWSPDSQWLVFNDATGLHVIAATGDTTWSINDGGSFPSWSPDGSLIAFDANRQIWLVRPDGSGLQAVTPPDTPSRDPDWSPDGSELVILRYPSNVTGEEIFRIRLSGGPDIRLTTDSHEERSPAWSPNGSLIAWNPWPRTSSGSIQPQVWVMDTAGANKRHLVNAETAPAWKPQGTQLVFSDQAGNGIRLFVINVDGTGLRQLTR